ncbi:putative ferric-chelate reductase 1 isoform X2 [Hyla sarda]|uniref:putative ferric-chelate reductase 1 isoform X2 n=1 Tax=Hyla sarda TaxID=327740 RepID=UPI0024C3E8DD|nr:putative ferric-chelate reductase 1 isoform X2 [Hyla sarda]
MNPLSQFVVALLVLFPLQVAAYSNGKVEASCVTMVPNHPYPIQNSSAPYTLTASNTTYQSGDKITVTLTNTTEEYPIEGFMIQVRQQNSNTPLGSFTVSGSEVQTLTCTTAASAVSHTSDLAKSIVQVTWIAPKENISDIYLRATVVRNGSIFWTNLVGPKLTYVGSGGSHLTVR